MDSPWYRLRALNRGPSESGDQQSRQDRWLQRCVRRNIATAYGRMYRFDEVSSIEDFRARLPVITYDDLSPWISRVAKGEEDILFKGRAIAYELTSGSSGMAKLIPYSEHSFRDFRAAIMPWLSGLVEHFGLYTGCAYFSISPVCRQPLELPDGLTVGMPDGAYLGDDVLEIFNQLCAVPDWVGELQSVEFWQLSTLYFLIMRQDLALVSVWSPSFFTSLLEGIASRADELLKLFRYGGHVAGMAFPIDIAASMRLQKYLETGDAAILWPRLKLVSCWADGASRLLFDMLRQRLPHASFQTKGLLSTEGVVTVPDLNGIPCLTVDSGFYEFLDERGVFWLSHELVDNHRYEVVMTTSGGLYRYRTGDHVVFKGIRAGLPALYFVGRSSSVSDLVGEKLTEEFVASCLGDLPGFAMLVPVFGSTPHYLLVIDQKTKLDGDQGLAAIEANLCENLQYAYARRIGQLHSLQIARIPNLIDRYVAITAEKGTRLGDIKVPILSSNRNWLDYVGAFHENCSHFT